MMLSLAWKSAEKSPHQKSCNTVLNMNRLYYLLICNLSWNIKSKNMLYLNGVKSFPWRSLIINKNSVFAWLNIFSLLFFQLIFRLTAADISWKINVQLVDQNYQNTPKHCYYELTLVALVFLILMYFYFHSKYS